MYLAAYSKSRSRGITNTVFGITFPWEIPAAGVRSKAYKHNGRQLRLVEFTDELFIPAGENDKHMGRPLTKVVKMIFVEDV